MRYALIFAGVAAAYDAYGYEAYGNGKASSSTPAQSEYSTTPAYGGYGNDHKTSSVVHSSKPTPASSKIGYTTIYPGYGKEPVTVTSQYQAYPTCDAAGSDGKSCAKWEEDKYVSTVINDYDSKKVTVTNVNKPVTVYHTKTTVTHYPTGSTGGKGGKAYPTGSYGSYEEKKNATKPWYELYEKVHEVKYKELGPHALPGYGGSGLCQTCDEEQPYKVKEYKDGKWSEYETKAIYKAPEPETKTYEKPGVYTEPAKDVTVTYPITKPAEATATAKAGEKVTYGGAYTDFKETGVKTCAYGAYETGKDNNGKDVTSTVLKTVTVTVSTTGTYEIAKPTVTVYDKDTEVKYPTTKYYAPGVYHKDAETVTITKSGDSYSCNYKQTKTYPATPEKTPSKGDEYPHKDHKSSSKPVNDKVSSTAYYPEYPVSTPSVSKASSKPHHEYPASTPSVETSTKPSYPEYPEYPESTPSVETSTKPSYPEYPESTPSYDDKKSSSTPCSSSIPAVETSTKPYPEYPESTPAVETSTKPSYPEYPESTPSVETSTKPSYPEYPESTPSYDDKKSSSTPCSSSTPAVETATKPYPEYPESTPAVETSTKPSYPEYPVVSSSSKPSNVESTSIYYPEYPATTTVPSYDDKVSSSTPCPSSTKPADAEKSSSAYAPEYPAASSSAPVYEAYPTPTPAQYTNAEFSYAPVPAKTEASYPEASSAYPEAEKGNGYGYAKRGAMLERRRAVVKRSSA